MINLTMDNLLLHTQTNDQLKQFLSKPAHALLLIGPTGSGKRTLAETVAAELLGISSGGSLAAYPYFLHLQPTPPKQEISIEAVRNLIRELKLSTPGTEAVKRVALVENADNMSLEAQNALLKILEEPSSSTIFILTAPTAHSVLPTVASRTQQVYVRPVSAALAQQFYAAELPNSEVEKAWQLSRGNVGLMQALLFEDKPHPLKEATEQGKKFLKVDKYQRLLMLDQLASDKKILSHFLDGLSKLLRALYSAQAANASRQRRQNLLDSWRLAQHLQQALDANANPKLINLHLLLALKI